MPRRALISAALLLALLTAACSRRDSFQTGRKESELPLEPVEPLLSQQQEEIMRDAEEAFTRATHLLDHTSLVKGSDPRKKDAWQERRKIDTRERDMLFLQAAAQLSGLVEA